MEEKSNFKVLMEDDGPMNIGDMILALGRAVNEGYKTVRLVAYNENYEPEGNEGQIEKRPTAELRARK